MLDHFFGTEWVDVEHDFSGHGRGGKVAVLAGQRPDLLPHLKVCYHEDRPDNCGRCPKCVTTMVALAAAGGLDAATAFPPLDLGLVREQRPFSLRVRSQWAEILVTLGTTGAQGELRRAMEHALRRTVRVGPRQRLRIARERLAGERPVLDPTWTAPEPGFDSNALARTLMHLRYGRPDGRRSRRSRPQPRFRMRGAQDTTSVPLMRAVDLRARHHRYAAGDRPPGEPAGELGGLLPDGVPLRLDARGVPVHPPLRGRPAAAQRAAWVLAPLAFAGVPLAARARGIVTRVRDLARPRPAPPGPATVAGHLHPEPGPGRVPLLLADHPVLPDRLLTTRAAEAADLGYSEPVVLGYLIDTAPAPPPCDVPWAHRYGLARREVW